MSWLGELVLNVHNWRHGVANMKSKVIKDASPVRFGIISAAAINYTALIDPTARSLEKAQAQIKLCKLSGVKAYGSYEELLLDTNVDAVYIPLPNGLHAQWAIRAMEAGKHVLIEKPIASNEEETANIRLCAERTGKVALEAFHWRFHPAAHRVKQLVDSGNYGAVRSVDVAFTLPGGVLAPYDIRFEYGLAGGACMDLTYVFSAATYFASPDMDKSTYNLLKAEPVVNTKDSRIDDAMRATFTVSYPGHNEVTCTTHCAMTTPWLFGVIPRIWEFKQIVVIELDNATISFDGFPGPQVAHSILVQQKDETGKLTGQKETQQCYVNGPQWGERGEGWWTTYRYQLEAFVKCIRHGDQVTEKNTPWITLDESVKLMGLIDSVYRIAGMPRRGDLTQ